MEIQALIIHPQKVPIIMADGDTSLDTNKKYWIQKGDCIVPPFNLTYPLC